MIANKQRSYIALATGWTTRVSVPAAVVWALFAAAILLIVLQVAWSLTLPAGAIDDGVQLAMALARMHGQIPNVDVYSVYPPLNVYLIYWSFRLLGSSIVTYRVFQTAVFVITYGGIWFSSAGMSRARRATLSLLIAFLSQGLTGLQSLTALALTALAVTGMTRSFEAPSRSTAWRVVAGAALGALALTRLNFALYLAAAIGAEGVLQCMEVRTVPPLSFRSALYLPLSAMAVSWALVAHWGGSLKNLLFQVVVMTSRSLAENVIQPVPGFMSLGDIRTLLSSGVLATCLPAAWLALRSLEAPTLILARRLAASAAALSALTIVLGHWFPLYLPAVCVPCAAATMYALRRLPCIGRNERLLLLLLTFQLHYVLSRPDGAHFLALMPVACMYVVAASLYGSRRAVGGLALVFVLIVGPQALYRTRIVCAEAAHRLSVVKQLPVLLRTRDGLDGGSCNRACRTFYPDDDERAAASYIQERTTWDEPVFAGFVDYRSIFVNDIRAYWLMDRPIGTRYLILMEGTSTGDVPEAQIVDDLRSRGVRWLLLQSGAAPRPIRRTSSVLNVFVYEQYERRSVFGSFEVWGKRKSL